MSTDALRDAQEELSKAIQEDAPEWYIARAQVSQAAALIALAEQAKRIADALNSIDTVLVNASGPDGAIKIDDRTDR